ncbi:polysaccharide biosynthesis protein PslH [Azospirillaceae bacterium]
MTDRKPLLFLSQRIPYPPNKGDKLRSFAVLRHLSSLWDVHLGCFIDDPVDWGYIEEVKAYCADLFCVGLDKRWAKIRSLRGLVTGASLSEPYFYNASLARWVDKVLTEARPSAIFLYSSVMGQYAPKAGEAGAPRVVMDFVDVDSDKWRQYAERQTWPMSWVYARESRRLLAFDRKVAARVDASVFVSSPEAELFRRLAPETANKVYPISNGIDLDFFNPELDFPDPFQVGVRRVVFTGAMDYWPNIDAVHWFADEILPALRARAPDIVFYIVGGNPTPDVTALAERPGVVVTGRVPDIRPYLAHSEVAVAPMRVARGIQNKVLEGMAMGKPVVTSDQGLEGIDAEPGRDLLTANTASEFVEAVMRILTDSSTTAIGSAARRRVVSKYDWSDKLASYQRLLQP